MINPTDIFLKELSRAQDKKLPEPTAMSLATVGEDGKPHVRVVLYKGIIREGFSFFTNYNSNKAKEIAYNNNVSAVFYWQELNVQVRIEGQAFKLTREESVGYFKTRARLSQLGAWASEQSTQIPSFQYLNEKLKIFDDKFKNQEVPCPEHWGGFHILPQQMEFWYGKEGRLHERFLFKKENNIWKERFLSP